MDRIIKFRLYDKSINKMIYPSEIKENSFETYYMDLKNGEIKLYQNCYDGGFFDENVIVMQFTGLYDKKGKEIYEGDIIKSYFENGLGAENKCLIIYDEYLCAFMGQELRTKQQYLFNEGNPNKKDKQLKYTEVIGNIYDNPELLGGKDGRD